MDKGERGCPGPTRGSTTLAYVNNSNENDNMVCKVPYKKLQLQKCWRISKSDGKKKGICLLSVNVQLCPMRRPTAC